MFPRDDLCFVVHDFLSIPRLTWPILFISISISQVVEGDLRLAGFAIFCLFINQMAGEICCTILLDGKDKMGKSGNWGAQNSSSAHNSKKELDTRESVFLIFFLYADHLGNTITTKFQSIWHYRVAGSYFCYLLSAIHLLGAF